MAYSSDSQRADRGGVPILAIGLALGTAIRLVVILTGVEVADVQHLHSVGAYFLAGKNPYSLPPFESNFPPVALGLEVGAILVSRATTVPFHIVFKLWPLVADVATAILIYRFLRQGYRSPKRAGWWACAFLLNPISIIITAAHGQLDPVTNFLSLLALVLLVRNPARWFGWSATSLGCAIAIKPNPVLLLPIFLTAPGLAPRQRASYLALACAPTVVTLLPFFLDNPSGVIGNLFTYGGEYDFGYLAVLRGAWYLRTGSAWLPSTIGDAFVDLTPWMFGAGYLALLAFGVGRLSLPKLCTVAYVLFYSVFTGLSAQYSVWVVPFAILAEDWFVLGYTVGTTLALVGFYLLFWPSILLGSLNPYRPFLAAFRPWYFWGVLSAWVVNVGWLVRSVVDITRDRGGHASPDGGTLPPSVANRLPVVADLRGGLIVIGLAVFAVSLERVARLVVVMVQALQ